MRGRVDGGEIGTWEVGLMEGRYRLGWMEG